MHNVQQSHLVPHVLQKTACVVWPSSGAQFTETLQLSLLRPWSGLSSAQHVAYWRLKISISNFTSFWYPILIGAFVGQFFMRGYINIS